MEDPQGPEDLDALKQAVLEKYKLEGRTEEFLAMLDGWKVKKTNEAIHAPGLVATINSWLEIIDLCVEVGNDKDDCIRDYEDLKESAYNAGLNDLMDEIERRILPLL